MRTNLTPSAAPATRTLKIPQYGDPALGPLSLLPGTWANIRPENREGSSFAGSGPFAGRGWNMIALPFADGGRNYRVLMNQYNEVLTFKVLDNDVPNRGIDGRHQTDQLIAALDYEQVIAQIDAEDCPKSGKAGGGGDPIHHEPGFFLHMKNQRTDDINIARLASIPHGDALTAIGTGTSEPGAPNIPVMEGFPEGISAEIAAAVAQATDPSSYLHPYHHFTQNPFKGLFSPADTTELLRVGLPEGIERTTTLALDTELLEAGIRNIPFIVRQADATAMKSFFWIMETSSKETPLVLAYAQFIFLDFFGPRRDGRPGLIRWPHVSINMMEKIAEADAKDEASPAMTEAMR